jgi:hypothetical protein
MANISRNFVAGRMNKSVDERLIPNGEYIDAMNVRLGSSESSNIGALENTVGNIPLTRLTYPDLTPLSIFARAIGALQDGANETIYWMVHDPQFSKGATGKLDMIVSFNQGTGTLRYHVVSINDGGGVNTTLNFNPSFLITGINLIDSNNEGLLFWVQGNNQPRYINISRTYAPPVGFIDQFSAESLLVIKRPPIQAPSIQTLATGGQQNFLEERFISFAYRYRYADGEYSATSQFSAPAFVPNPFQFNVSSFLNQGMVNAANTAVITYNTGGPLVVGIDLLFKENQNGIIRVIEKIDKSDLGLPNNTNIQYTFSNSKIFTVLPESEILRLYDNVPIVARAQTIMGNRIVYGNYDEGYDLIDKFGNPIRLNYKADLISREINNESIPDETISSGYSINGTVTIPNSAVEVDLSSVATNLKAGALLNISLRLSHASFTGSTPSPTEQTQNVSIEWSFTLPQDYPSVFAMATSAAFLEAVGTVGNIKPVFHPTNPTSCDGFTFTDVFNCALPNNLSGTPNTTKFSSGISAAGQPILVTATPSGNKITFQMPAMRYVGSTSNPNAYSAYEYYQIDFASASWSGLSTPKSLHSNRGYEVAIVYMDGELRASTALVSQQNTIHVPCSFCDRQNQVRATIPITQRAPHWAKRYKFVIKADREGYETVYASIFFRDPATNNAFILLEGENTRKVETGDRLIVKSDSAGPAQSCAYITVLEKDSKERGFLEIPSTLDPSANVEVPAGVYIKVNPNQLTLVQDELSYITQYVEKTASGSGNYPQAYLLVNRLDTSTGNYIDYSIPAGSRIRLNFEFERRGSGDGNNSCEKRTYTLDVTLVASADYDNFKDWWDGDNVEDILNNGTQVVGAGGCDVDNQYDSTTATTIPAILNPNICINRYRFYRNPADNALFLAATGTRACGTTQNRKSKVVLKLEVFRAENTLIFETEPQDTLPDVFYENNLSFEVGPNGEHFGNVQNQNFNSATPAIVDTEFYNCFAFGNGAESYKIRDSIVGKTFGLGNRVVTVSAQDYKRANRFADLTYSGVYNDESNVNRLNEFNLGLLNFKPLEDSFGPITLIDGRETDILVLQEDKISYVLAGKNLLSDAAAGGAIASVPEVLGTQIARIENYGNSFNPESYAKWGESKFFTDVKRGSVIQLKGDSYSNEQMSVISEANMRPWFRDMFIQSTFTQKLGGYDPYMGEYVLSSNIIQIPKRQQNIPCNTPQAFNLSGVVNEFTYVVDLGTTVGPFTVSWDVALSSPGAILFVNVVYDGVTYDSGPQTTFGSFDIPKPNNTPRLAFITVYSLEGEMTVQVNASCPQPTQLKVVQVVVTDQSDGGKFIHAEYGYTSGSYISPLTSNLVSFSSASDNPLVSLYSEVIGNQGSGSIPTDGSTVAIMSNKINFDDFDFDPSLNKLRWLRTDTVYDNTQADVIALLTASNDATPIIGSSPTYMAQFLLVGTEGILYLIWDLRKPKLIDLCYSDSGPDNLCCACNNCTEICSEYEVLNDSKDNIATFKYVDCDTQTIKFVNLPESESIAVCSVGLPEAVSGVLTITKSECGCK